MRAYLVLFFVGLGVFAAFAGPRLMIHSHDNHFVYLADAFLKGQTELTRTPPHQNDWANYEVLSLKGASAATHGAEVRGFFTYRQGKRDEFRLLSGEEIQIPARDRGESRTRYFVSFPPMPAVLMMPMVAISGYGANDVIFTVFFAALNAPLLLLLLNTLTARGYGLRTPRENAWLTVLFVFGTAHLWCGALGRVWFTALIVGVTFHLLYLYFALGARHPLWAGLALAAGFSTRATLVFAALFFYLELFFPADGARPPPRVLWRRLALFSLPPLIVGVTLLVYNHARFENPLEFGHAYLAGGRIPRIRDFGMFDFQFLNRNLAAALTLLPRVVDKAPYLQLSNHGMSLFVTTPALLLLLWPIRRSALARRAGLTALVVALPIAFYQNTGWHQFGFRFSLDFMPYLIIALALGGRALDRTFKALIIAGVLVNAVGAGTFKRVGKLYADFLTEEPKR
ncbi:hypothetical protein KKF91_12750 [Myxococcota bacterium]|nr:hypothetical protein [Myxococcota bacterium]MBU1431403.1 hypothetical protein [Myxococcota bacterium]MBU1898521.1 hypothetical protein [Myxococcota bacterium]